MTASECFEIWAPPAALWSRWAKPILFAETASSSWPAPADELLPSLGKPGELDLKTALIVDLPGADSVKTGLILAQAGYRPVPLYNGAPGPTLSIGATVLIDVLPIMRWLVPGAQLLSKLALPPEAAPIFLLDAQRLAPQASRAPGRFDNRWVVFPQDFPSANFLRAHGIERALLVQPGGRLQPATDLAHVLLRWQEGGIRLSLSDSTLSSPLQPLNVVRPSHFRALWQRALALVGLRRNSAGGFGAIIPHPSSHHG